MFSERVHFEPSLDTLSFRSDVMNPIKMFSPLGRSVMAVLTIAGAETSGITSAWLLHRFAQNPAKYAQARIEVPAHALSTQLPLYPPNRRSIHPIGTRSTEMTPYRAKWRHIHPPDALPCQLPPCRANCRTPSPEHYRVRVCTPPGSSECWTHLSEC